MFGHGLCKDDPDKVLAWTPRKAIWWLGMATEWEAKSQAGNTGLDNPNIIRGGGASTVRSFSTL